MTVKELAGKLHHITGKSLSNGDFGRLGKIIKLYPEILIETSLEKMGKSEWIRSHKNPISYLQRIISAEINKGQSSHLLDSVMTDTFSGRF